MTDEMSDLRVSIASAGGEMLVAIDGDLDIGTRAAFRDHLDAAIGSTDGDLALDMAGVAFCDSSALHVLAHAQRQLLDAGRRLRIVRPSRPVDRVLWLSGLAEVFGIAADD